MGCDVVKPNKKPVEVAKLVLEEVENVNAPPTSETRGKGFGKGFGLKNEDEDDGVIDVTEWE